MAERSVIVKIYLVDIHSPDHPTVPQLISSRFSAEGRSFSQQIPGCGLRIKGSDPISPLHPSHPQITPRSVWVSVLLCAASGHQIETLR
jgi:hypothetical protein